MTYDEKIKLRKSFKDTKDYMKDKEPKFMAFIPMRGGYFRGISVDKKKTVEDYFPSALVLKVKYKDK